MNMINFAMSRSRENRSKRGDMTEAGDSRFGVRNLHERLRAFGLQKQLLYPKPPSGLMTMRTYFMSLAVS